jgi:hypothetical protein
VNILSAACAVYAGLPALVALHFQWPIPGRGSPFVAKYEGGERRIDVVEFLTIYQAIGVDPAKLLKALKRAIATGNQRV